MSKEKTNEMKRRSKEQREKIAEEEVVQKKLKQSHAEDDSINRGIKVVDPSELTNITTLYERFTSQYKKTHPDFDEKKNTIKDDKKKGVVWLNFKDADAEEAFVRHIAQKATKGAIFHKKIKIASFQDGQLIDTRTNKAFGEGEYAKLIKQLDAGIQYNDIKLPESTAPSPFSTTPSPAGFS
tara:strand:+ start:96 stop:641 length:546 start_codon:yes stop_codon:yes gene_type:complete